MNKVVLKISGEFLKENEENVADNKINYVASLIKDLKDQNIHVSVVIGGGNYFRGRQNNKLDAVTGDTIGMLGTVMNSLYLKDALRRINIPAVVTTPFTFPELLKNYTSEEIKNTSDVVIFGGGIGKSGYSTDSAVVNASIISDAKTIIKLTNVDGVYDSDPHKNKDAKKFTDITFNEVLNQKLEVMDLYAIEKCMEQNKTIVVMNINNKEEILSYFKGNKIGTTIHN